MGCSRKMSLVFLTGWLFAIMAGFTFSTFVRGDCASCIYCETLSQFGMTSTDEEGQPTILYGGQTLEGTNNNWVQSAVNGELPSTCSGFNIYKPTCNTESEACSLEADPAVGLQLWTFSSATWSCDFSNPGTSYIMAAEDGQNPQEFGTANQKVCDPNPY
jgi:hypothetical protein